MLVYSRLLRPIADEGLSCGRGTSREATRSRFWKQPPGLIALGRGTPTVARSRNALKDHAVAARPREAIANISDSSSENSFSHVQ